MELEEAYSLPEHEGRFHFSSNVPIVDIFEESGIRRLPSNSNVQKWLNADRPVLADSTNTVPLDNINAQLVDLNIKNQRGRRGKTNQANKNKNRREALSASRHLNNMNMLRRKTSFIQARLPPTTLSAEVESEYISIISSIESKHDLGQGLKVFETHRSLSEKLDITQMMTLSPGKKVENFVLWEYLQLVQIEAQRMNNIKLCHFGVYNALINRDYEKAIS